MQTQSYREPGMMEERQERAPDNVEEKARLPSA